MPSRTFVAALLATLVAVAVSDVQCIGPCCPGFHPPMVGVNATEACQLIQDSRGQGLTFADCARLCGGDAGFENSYECFLPQDYVQQVLEMNGLPTDGGVLDGGALVCPAGAYVSCLPLCVGEA